MSFYVGFDPGTVTTAVAVVDEVCRLTHYLEFPSSKLVKESPEIIRFVKSLRPKAVALPSGFGLPFKSGKELTEHDIFLMALDSPKGEGPLRTFLRTAWLLENSFTVPGVIELDSVPEYRKFNLIDMGTADKVAASVFYMTLYDSFILVEMGSAFNAVVIVKDRKVVDGFGGTVLPGPNSLGAIDGEVVQLFGSILTKKMIYTPHVRKRYIEILRMVAEWYSKEIGAPIVVSGKRKDEFPTGIKHSFPFKEAAVGSAYIANAYGGGRCSYLLDSLKAKGTPLDYVVVSKL